MQMKFIFQEESEIHFSRRVSSLRLQCSFKKTKSKEDSECVVSEIIEVRVQINHLPRFRANEISFEKKGTQSFSFCLLRILPNRLQNQCASLIIKQGFH